jgi:hypothetical protein
MTAVWCRLCRRDHILKTCEMCGCDLKHGHVLIHFCEPCKKVVREQRAAIKAVEAEGEST